MAGDKLESTPQPEVTPTLERPVATLENMDAVLNLCEYWKARAHAAETLATAQLKNISSVL